jgi:cytochrome c biogenesis protein CcdA/thiol-disulfide isomerase/thioredoxin
MILLVFFAFIAGLVTILSPCILPVLPIVLGSATSGGKKRPVGIITGFIFSFTFFTLSLSYIVKATGLPSDSLRIIAIILVGLFGFSMLVPSAQIQMEKMFSILSGFLPKNTTDSGFIGGVVVGLCLGLLWTPCVGPILASVITLAATSSVNFTTIIITLAYSIGTAIPMFAIMYGGKSLLLLKNSASIQKIFGVLMILTAIAMYFNVDRTFQTYILEKFPNYGAGLTKFEDIAFRNKSFTSTTPDFIAGGEWINSKPLTISELRGKVILVDFWTYTCINCIRTLPYIKAWNEKYKDKGLVIVGVHTPEFEFEKEAKNVKKAIKDFGITYPVMQDNDYATWNAYNNHYWPAHYLIDKNGVIRDTHFGEGNYDETEKHIQELLNVSMPIHNATYYVSAETPETYLGSARDGGGYTLAGNWTKSPEYALPQMDATLTFLYEAANVYLVMRPKDKSGRVEVYLDGKLLQTITVDSEKLYTLISLPTPGQHELQLKFLDNNLELYAFTFG